MPSQPGKSFQGEGFICSNTIQFSSSQVNTLIEFRMDIWSIPLNLNQFPPPPIIHLWCDWIRNWVATFHLDCSATVMQFMGVVHTCTGDVISHCFQHLSHLETVPITSSTGLYTLVLVSYLCVCVFVCVCMRVRVRVCVYTGFVYRRLTAPSTAQGHRRLSQVQIWQVAQLKSI